MTNGISKARSLLQATFVGLALLFSSSVLAIVMEDIEFSSLPGDKIEIRMIFDGVPPDPTGYTIEQPARIALDLAGVKSKLPAKHHSLGSGNARSVTVVEGGDRTRVIVAMTELVAYRARVLGNSLYVLVGEDDSGLITSTTTDGGIGLTNISPKDASVEEGFLVVEEIDFRRGEDGEGRVIVRLSDVSVGKLDPNVTAFT